MDLKYNLYINKNLFSELFVDRSKLYNIKFKNEIENLTKIIIIALEEISMTIH